ncbi:MAG: hypothetical protein PVH68_04305 [Armatimonadota bacterium]|jgi:hypothetical protein
MTQRDDEELEPRWDIGINLSGRAWVALIAGGLVLVLTLCFGIRHFFQTRGPATVYEKYLDLEDEEQ